MKKFKSDIEIARSCKLKPISKILKKIVEKEVEDEIEFEGENLDNDTDRLQPDSDK